MASIYHQHKLLKELQVIVIIPIRVSDWWCKINFFVPHVFFVSRCQSIRFEVNIHFGFRLFNNVLLHRKK